MNSYFITFVLNPLFNIFIDYHELFMDSSHDVKFFICYENQENV